MTERSLRVAMLSVHTSPLDQPGTGDAGGMNVYVVELSRALARRGVDVEVFTRATSSELPSSVDLTDGVRVRHIEAGPFDGLDKNDLPGQLCAFTAGLMHTEARQKPGFYDVIHSHYWLSGQVGWLASDRWNVPLVHSMHTLAKVKNLALAPGDKPEPVGRVIGEEQVVRAADRLVANTDAEARELIELYEADPDRVSVVSPGVDVELFNPGGPGARERARAELRLPADRDVIVFAGRIQPLKAPDVLVQALGVLAASDPVRPLPLLVVIGGPSGDPYALAKLKSLAARAGVSEHIRWQPPVPRPQLPQWFRAADVVAVPSRSESFGLVAAEAQAVGTPVLAADVGGLQTIIRDGSSGLLVPGHDPRAWAEKMRQLLDDRALYERLVVGARARIDELSWDNAADEMISVYRNAWADLRHKRGRILQENANGAAISGVPELSAVNLDATG